jgi:TM2 domain-containing membrane protein YozV
MNRGKQKVVAGILGILIGGLGIHHFYLGSMGAGVVCLLLSCVGIGPLLGLIEGIMLLIMKDEEFEARYNMREPASMEFVFMKPS